MVATLGSQIHLKTKNTKAQKQKEKNNNGKEKKPRGDQEKKKGISAILLKI